MRRCKATLVHGDRELERAATDARQNVDADVAELAIIAAGVGMDGRPSINAGDPAELTIST